MLRFLPDNWLEFFLRPFLLIDPAAGLYIEIHAPDWRFAALIVLLVVGLVLHRRHAWLAGSQVRALVGLAACFYLWTLVSGNGRYFIWGLLLVGPLLVMVTRRLPATRAMRNTLLLGVLGLQGLAVSMTFEPNIWAMRKWVDGPGLSIEDTPLKREPAVYLTIGTISYSVLVPQLHPQARWSNIIGQQDIVPGLPEYERLQSLLDSPLQKYVVVRATRLVMSEDRQPIAEAHQIIVRALARQRLELTGQPCQFVRTNLAGLPYTVGKAPVDDGFWFCTVTRSQAPPPPEVQIDTSLDPVFEHVEKRCPRFFPPGGARTRVIAEGLARFYPYSDVGLTVNHAGDVYYKYYRALNPTVIGNADAVRRGAFTLDCSRLPGRYAPPWARD